MSGEKKSRWPILAVLVLAFLLRGFGVFDAALPYSFYGDEINNLERSVNFWGEDGFDLNPHWFNKPALGYYVNFFVFGCRYLVGRHLTGEFDSPGQFADRFVNYERSDLYVLGRLLQALYGAIGVFLVWRIGRRIGGDRTGLLAAIMLAICPAHVHFSQVIKNDALAAVFMSLAFLAILDVARLGRLRDHLLAAAWIGLGFATKYTPAVLLGLLAVAHLMRPRAGGEAAIGWRAAVLVPLVFLLAAFVGSPYNFLDPTYAEQNLAGIARHFGRMVFGAGEVDPAKHTIAGLVLHGLGTTAGQDCFTWPLGLLALVGLLFGLRGRGRGPGVLVWGWVVLLYLVLASANPQRIRPNHLMAVFPVLALAAALGLERLAELLAARTGFPRPRSLALAVALLVLPWPGSPGQGLHDRARALLVAPPQKRAMDWIFANVPAGATIVNDHEVLVLKPSDERYAWIMRRIERGLEAARRGLASERERERGSSDYDREESRRIIRHHERMQQEWTEQRKRFRLEMAAAPSYPRPRYDVFVVEKPWQTEKGGTLAPFHGYNPLWEPFPLPSLDLGAQEVAGLADLPPVERYRVAPDRLATLADHQRELYPLLPGRPVDFWVASEETFDNYDMPWKREEFPAWSAFFDDLRRHYDAVEIRDESAQGAWSIRVYDLRRRRPEGAAELRRVAPR